MGGKQSSGGVEALEEDLARIQTSLSEITAVVYDINQVSYSGGSDLHTQYVIR